MKLVYFWIDEYKSIKQQGINFGSRYIYSSSFNKESNTLTIDRVENERYIPNFYHTDADLSKHILEVTALVGQNGAGKSTMLEALRNALTKDIAWFEYLIVYEDFESGEIFFDRLQQPSSSMLALVATTEEEEEKEITSKLKSNKEEQTKYHFNFKCTEKNVSWNSPSQYKVINYRTSFDNNFYPITHDNNKWIDVSTDWLLYEEKYKFESVKPEQDQVSTFLSNELERQLQLSDNEHIRTLLQERINLPNVVNLSSWGNSMPRDTSDRGSVWNIPHSLLSTYDILFAKLNEEMQRQMGSENSKSPEIAKNGTKGKVYVFFLEHLLQNTFYHLNQNNRYLDKSFNTEKINFTQFDFESCVKEFYKEFMNSGFIDNYESILELIDYIKGLISTHEVVFIHSYIIEIKDLSVDEIRKILFYQNEYLETLNYLRINDTAKSFFSFEWRGMSSGEYALFNLFARLYHGAQSIIDVPLVDRGGIALPETIYLLLDEPDSSFHLQWEKELIKLLVENIAAVFTFEKEDSKYIPNIQIIYTTHSPVSLSDIPGYNINYFRKEGSGRLVVLDEKLKPQNSFGANIHALMRDSFFLQQGLIGDFVAKKINGIIELLNKNEKLSDNEIDIIQNILNIVDEPLLKTKLEEMFNEKLKDQGNFDLAVKRLECLKKEIEEKIVKMKGRHND